jgi:hypothetical protein
MPYDISNPPAKLSGLSDKKKRQFIHVFNSCYSEHHDDEKCHKMAWGAVGGKSACVMCGDDDDEDMEASGCPCWAKNDMASEILAVAKEILNAGR